ncbi:MAG: methyl-accepting chemotaxis protein, partial [Paenisporosarcina sp.]|nr:methyl-accepting chemotaxis protein [Paenisporosarcina sp.]
LLPLQYIEQIQTNNRALDSYTLEYILNEDSGLTAELIKSTQEKEKQQRELIAAFRESSNTQVNEDLMTEFEGLFNTYLIKVFSLQSRGVTLNKEQAYEVYLSDVKEPRRALNKIGDQIAENIISSSQKLEESNQSFVAQATWISNLVILIAIVLFSILGLFISRMIVKPIKKLQVLMKQAGDGDLTVQGDYRSKDEVGQLNESFNEMTSTLRTILQQVTNTSELVAASSEELTANSEETTKATEMIAHTMEEMANGSTQQIQSVEETVVIVKEVSTGVTQIASNAKQVEITVLEASEKAILGNGAIGQAISQMQSINQTVNGLSDVVKGLGEKSNAIGQIIESITNIASQTNLLALNAAIEAARAGEQGKGFAVVADEVRKLAEESANSAQQIASLVASIQGQTHEAVQSMDQATEEVDTGITVVNKAGESFQQIQHAVSQVANEIQEVTVAIEQISKGTDQIVSNVDVIADVSETVSAGTQNVSAASEEQLASMEEIASSSSALSKMAEDLQVMINKFKV